MTLKLRVYVQPGASSREIKGIFTEHQAIKIRLRAQAQNNQANKELLKYLHKTLGVKYSLLNILSGMSSRIKLIKIDLSGQKQSETNRIIEILKSWDIN